MRASKDNQPRVGHVKRISNHSQIIGIDIGGTKIKMVALSSEGDEVARRTCKTNDHPGSDIPAFAKTVRQILNRFPENSRLRVGIASPGLVSKNGRSIAFQSGKMHGIEGFDWTDFLQMRNAVPVLNDAHAALLGEVWKGAAQGCQNAIMLTLGTGVGGAIMSDGRLLKGTIGRAGHLGHVSIGLRGERSIFGMPGALETAIGNYTLARRSGGRFNSTEELVKAYLAGDAVASRIWLKSVQALARAIASFINCLDPEAVVVGGGVAQAGAALFDPLNRYLDDLEWRPGGHRVRILRGALGEWAGAYGAARSAMQVWKNLEA